jgi:hypothetical protein
MDTAVQQVSLTYKNDRLTSLSDVISTGSAHHSVSVTKVLH